METEAETGMMRPQYKEHLEVPETGRGQEGSSPRAFGRSTALPHLAWDFWPPEP